MEFERPTSQQRIDEVAEVARMMRDPPPPTSILFGEGNTARISIGHPLSVPDQLDILKLEQNGSKGRGSEKPKKPQHHMKANQVRHTENLSGLNGWYNGKYYVNGQPANNRTNGKK